MTIDLNLLIVFDTVMAERNLRRAADRLGRSQPAISQSVARLRDLFGDRLFEKVPTGVRPTPRAEALWEEMRGPIDALRARVAPADFDPATARGDLTIGLSDDLHDLCFASLVADVREVAPGLRLVAGETDHQSIWPQLAAGRFDLALSVAPPPPRGLAGTVIAEMPFALLHRADRAAPAELDVYLAAEHVSITFGAGEAGYVDDRLAAGSHTRRIIASSSRFAVMADLVRLTGALATLPLPIARHLATRIGLAVAPLPFALDPVAVRIGWHQRRRAEPLHQWLRDRVAERVREMLGDGRHR